MDEERALYIVRAGEAGAIERVLRDYSEKKFDMLFSRGSRPHHYSSIYKTN